MLAWESAGTDETADQNADSRRGEHSYWSLGPTSDGRWGVELIVRDDDLEERQGDGLHLGHFDSEAAAKAAATAYENGEPMCCGTPMVHNSGTLQYECGDAYFGLLDDGVLSESVPDRSDTDAMDDHQRERFEHWRNNRLPSIPYAAL